MSSGNRLTRGKVPSNRINPELNFSAEADIDHYSSGATRPPVVGREGNFDPELTKYYNSNDNHLAKYLKTLEQKATIDQHRITNRRFDDSSSISLPSTDDDEVGKGLRFIKSQKPVAKPMIGSADAATRTAVPFVQPARISSALQKAQLFSKKYKPVEILSKSNETALDSSMPHSSTIVPLASDPESVHSSSQKSLQSLLNIKDLINLPSSNSSVPGTDSELSVMSFAIRLKSLNDLSELPESHVTQSLLANDESVRPIQHSSEHLSQLKVDAVSEYADDFEEESDITAVDSSISEDASVQAELTINQEDSAGSKSVGSSSIDVNSIFEKPSEVNGSRAVNALRNTMNFTISGSKQAKACKAQKGFHKGTQTYPTHNEVEPNVIVMRYYPAVSQPLFPAYIEAMSPYNPSVAILNQMMRQHVLGIRQFVNFQQRSYEVTVNLLKPNFHYTTWDHVQKLIKKQQIERHPKL